MKIQLTASLFVFAASTLMSSGQINITDVSGPTGVFTILTNGGSDIQIGLRGEPRDLNVAGLGFNGVLEGSFPNASFLLRSVHEGTSINLADSVVDVERITISSFQSGSIGLDTNISNATLRSSTNISVQGKDVHFGENTIFDTDIFTVEANSIVIDDPANFFGPGQSMPTTSVNGSTNSLVFEEEIDFSKSITFTSLSSGGGDIWLTFDRINNVIDENFGFADIGV